jgi:8-oxo-dGTP pyrophosphatase MutT (NUDIX family)
MNEKPGYYYNQSAVIPFIKEGEEFKVILITTRKKKKWTIPKGIIEPDLDSIESARNEANEEAGIDGYIEPVIFDNFEYEKWGGICHVKVYLMEVNQIMDEWPEMNFRQREFFDPDRAVEIIGREEIKTVLNRFKQLISY